VEVGNRKLSVIQVAEMPLLRGLKTSTHGGIVRKEIVRQILGVFAIKGKDLKL
jgi:hypothetical protein